MWILNGLAGRDEYVFKPPMNSSFPSKVYFYEGIYPHLPRNAVSYIQQLMGVVCDKIN